MGAALKLHQPTKDVKSKQSLVTLIRKLRPLLPGKVTKDGPVAYIVEGKVLIEFNYYCTWEEQRLAKKTTAEEMKSKTCHPSYIKVSFMGDYLKTATKDKHYNPQSSAVFRAKIHNPGKGGEFNLERVATSVTKCIEAVDEHVAKRIERNEKHRQYNKLETVEGIKLEKVLPKRFKREFPSTVTQYIVPDGEELESHRVELVVNRDTHVVTYSYDFNNLTLAQLKTLLSVKL